MTGSTRTTRPTTLRLITIGIAATGLCAVGTGLAVAANAGSDAAPDPAPAVEVEREGVDRSAMPEGYTQAQYEAFWGAGFSAEDVAALETLWSLDTTQAKARAGQLVLDGADLPFAPGTYGAPDPASQEVAALDAFFAAGYQWPEVEQLAALWNVDTYETKIQAGQLLLDGQPVPVAPSGTPADDAATTDRG